MPDDVIDDEAIGLLGQPPAAVDAVTAPDAASAQPFINQTLATPPPTVPPGGAGGAGTLPGGVPDVAPPPAAAPAAPVPAVPPPAGAPVVAPVVDQAALIEKQRLADVANAEAKLKADQLAKTAAAEHLRREQEIADQVARARTAAELKVDEASDYLNDHREVRDPRSSWSVVDRISAIVAQMFGALGSGMQSVATGRSEPNQAVAIINKRIADEIDRQKEGYRRASDAFVRAKAGVKDVDEARRILEEQENARDVAYHKDALAQAAELLDQQGVAAADIARDQRIVELNKYLDASREKAIENQLKNEKLRAEAEALRARAARDQRKAKGGGAGAGVGGDAAEELARRIRMGKDGRALTDDEVIHDATELKIPLEAKAGHVSLKTIRAMAAFDASLAARTRGTEVKGQAQIDKEAGAWAKENGVNDIAKKQRELSAVLDEVKNAPHNPLGQALAVEKAVSAARGGAASKQALALALQHLGGKWDTIEALVQGARDGELGEKQMENFIGFMTNQLGTSQKEGKDAYDNFNKFVETQPAEKRAGLLAARGQLFSGLHGFGGGGHADHGVGVTKMIGGKTYVKRGPNSWELQP